MSKKLPVKSFRWLDNLSMFTEEFIKSYDEDSDKGYILGVDAEYPKKYIVYIMTYHFYLKE